MEKVLKNGFCELKQEEMEKVDGGFLPIIAVAFIIMPAVAVPVGYYKYKQIKKNYNR